MVFDIFPSFSEGLHVESCIVLDSLFFFLAFSSQQNTCDLGICIFHINNIYKAWFIKYIPYFEPEIISRISFEYMEEDKTK